MSQIDRWIIGALVMALSGVLWFLLLDSREELSHLKEVVSVNSNRLTAIEARLAWVERHDPTAH